MNIYTYYVDPEKHYFIVYQNDDEIYRSHEFRLEVQAEAKAKKFISDLEGAKGADIVLDVQNLSIDPDTLFGGKRNG